MIKYLNIIGAVAIASSIGGIAGNILVNTKNVNSITKKLSTITSNKNLKNPYAVSPDPYAAILHVKVKNIEITLNNSTDVTSALTTLAIQKALLIANSGMLSKAESSILSFSGILVANKSIKILTIAGQNPDASTTIFVTLLSKPQVFSMTYISTARAYTVSQTSNVVLSDFDTIKNLRANILSINKSAGLTQDDVNALTFSMNNANDQLVKFTGHFYPSIFNKVIANMSSSNGSSINLQINVLAPTNLADYDLALVAYIYTGNIVIHTPYVMAFYPSDPYVVSRMKIALEKVRPIASNIIKSFGTFAAIPGGSKVLPGGDVGSHSNTKIDFVIKVNGSTCRMYQ